MTTARGCAIGCLVMVAIALALAAFAAVLGFGVFGVIRHSDVAQEALRRAAANPEAVALLGEPVEPGWWVSGSIETTGPSGTASLSIPVKGPKGSGTLYLEATKQAGAWRYSLLQLAPESGPRIDLLAGEAVAPQPPPFVPDGGPARR